MSEALSIMLGPPADPGTCAGFMRSQCRSASEYVAGLAYCDCCDHDDTECVKTHCRLDVTDVVELCRVHAATVRSWPVLRWMKDANAHV